MTGSKVRMAKVGRRLVSPLQIRQCVCDFPLMLHLCAQVQAEIMEASRTAEKNADGVCVCVCVCVCVLCVVCCVLCVVCVCIVMGVRSDALGANEYLVIVMRVVCHAVR